MYLVRGDSVSLVGNTPDEAVSKLRFEYASTASCACWLPHYCVTGEEALARIGFDVYRPVVRAEDDAKQILPANVGGEADCAANEGAVARDHQEATILEINGVIDPVSSATKIKGGWIPSLSMSPVSLDPDRQGLLGVCCRVGVAFIFNNARRHPIRHVRTQRGTRSKEGFSVI